MPALPYREGMKSRPWASLWIRPERAALSVIDRRRRENTKCPVHVASPIVGAQGKNEWGAATFRNSYGTFFNRKSALMPAPLASVSLWQSFQLPSTIEAGSIVPPPRNGRASWARCGLLRRSHPLIAIDSRNALHRKGWGRPDAGHRVGGSALNLATSRRVVCSKQL